MQSGIVGRMATNKVTNSNSKKKQTSKKTAPVDAAADPVAESMAAKSKDISADEMKKLRKINLWAGLVLAAEAIVIVLFGGAKTTEVTMGYSGVDQLASDVAGNQVLGLASRHIFDIRFSVVAVMALAVLALCFFGMATVRRARYEALLKNGMHVMRWMSFGLAGGLMVVALAQVTAVTDIALLVTMLVMTAIGFSLQPLSDKLRREGTHGVVPKLVCSAAITLVATPWLVLLAAVIGALAWGGHVPVVNYAMYAVTALFFGCWVLAGSLRVRRQGKWADTFYTEKMYVFLAAASASVLAWQIFAKVL